MATCIRSRGVSTISCRTPGTDGMSSNTPTDTSRRNARPGVCSDPLTVSARGRGGGEIHTAAAASAANRPVGAPRPAVLWAIGIAGCLSAGVTMWLALNSDRSEPGLEGALSVWISLPYIVGGLITWWRRPDSRFGPLMLAAGWITFLTTGSFSTLDLSYTIGQFFDLVPAAIFLHVFLAYQSGYLRNGLERLIVVAGYVTSIGLQIPKLMLGGSGPDNLLEVASRPDTAATLEKVELWSLIVLLTAGVVLL